MDPHDDVAPKDPGAQKPAQTFDERDFEAENKQREYSEIRMADTGQGYKYQLSVTAYLASLMSKNETVEDYRIFYEVKDVEPFDDIVLAVKYNGSEDFRLYLIQVKSGKVTLDVNKYLSGYRQITQKKNWKCLKNINEINEGNIQFWFFACKVFTKTPNFTFEEDSGIKKLKLKDRECVPGESIIDEMCNKSHKLCLKSNNITTKDQGFFDNFYIYLGQPNEEKILSILRDMWKFSDSSQVIHYLDKYFIKDENYCLSKTVFEHEMLRIRLSDYIVTPVKTVPVKKEPAHAWINLTLSHNVTIIESAPHSKASLFGCILSKIGDKVTVDEWNTCVGNEGKLTKEVKDKFISETFKPQTTKDLVIHFWMSNKISLILEAEDDLPALKEFSHLKRHYIIIDSKLKKRYGEMESYNLSVIKDLGGLQADELLQSISVSMQGKKPTSLYEVINGDQTLFETLTCLDILKLIEPKRVYLQDKCFKDGREMLFIIETAITEEYDETIEDNILMYCPPNQGDLCYQKAVQNPKYKNYKIYRLYAQHSENGEEKLSLTNEYRSNELQLIEAENIAESNWTEDYRGLEYFFVDQHGNYVYRENEDEVVPIIGEMVNTSCPTYLTRRMRTGIITQEENRSSTDNILNSVIEYTEEPFSENDFFIGTTRKICVVTGEPGIGKSTFLRSLARICDPEYYVLFYDLALYQTDLYDKSKKQSEFCRDPLKFLSNKHNSLPYNKFLSALKKVPKRLIIVLDSIDEVVATCKGNVLKLIDKLNREPCLNKIIVGSRPLTVDLLSNQFDVDLVEIDGLNVEWNGDYIQNWNIDENYIETIPAEFLENPLYLNFLRIIAANNVNIENLNRWSLYTTIIDLKIDRYYERRNENPDDAERNNLLKYCYALAFQAFLPDHKITKKISGNIKEKYTNFLRIGIIKCFNKKGVPVFLHHTFQEYLVSRWLIEASDREDRKYIYGYLLTNSMHYILNIYSEQFRLHKAVIDKDVMQVHNLCKENPELLKEIDVLGRTALHMAVIKPFHFKENIEITSIIFQNTLAKNFNLYPCDKLLKWTWIEHLHTFIDYGIFSQQLVDVLEAYWHYQYRIKNKSDWIFFMDDQRFSTFCSQAFEIPSINIIKYLFLLKYYNNKDLVEVDGLCSRSEITASMLPKSSKLELGTTLMHLGCIYSNLTIVSTCIDRGDDVNARDRFGCTPLYYGVCSQKTEIVRLLLEKGADMKLHPTNQPFITVFEMSLRMQNKNIVMILIEAMDKSFEGWDSSTPLHDAVKIDNVRVVEILLRGDINVNIQKPDGDTPLHLAVRYRNKSSVQLITQYHANPNITNNKGETPLFDALWEKDKQLMEILLNLGADVNIVNKRGNKLLEIAVQQRYSEDFIQLLLQYGADVNWTNRIGKTSLFYAVECTETQKVKILLNADVNVNIQDVNGNTALHIAVDRSYNSKTVSPRVRITDPDNNMQVIKMLFDANANVNIANKWGDTPLHKAVSVGYQYAVQLLVQHRATVCARNCQQETPLLLAVVKEQTEIINILLDKEVKLSIVEDDVAPLNLPETKNNISCKYRIDVNMESQSGDTPLCCAIKKGNVEIVNILLENGADVNYVDKNRGHLTPLFIAVETQNIEIVEILLRNGAEVNFKSEYDVTSFYVAVLTGNLNLVKLLLEYKPNLNIVSSINTSFAKAKQSGDINGVLGLLNCWANRSANSLNDVTFSNDVKHFIQTVEEESDINLKNEIRLDRKGNNVEFVDALLKLAADVTNSTPIGIKCLDAALELNDKEVDRILLRNFDDKYPEGIKRFTNVGYAAFKENRAMVKILLRNRQPTDNTFLTRVIQFSRQKYSVEILLENQIDVNLPDKGGNTPLIAALDYSSLDVVKLLLETGADVNNQIHGRTPLSVPITNYESKIVRMLIQRGVNIDMETASMVLDDGLCSSKNIVCMLLERGAGPNERDEHGKTALHYAVEVGREDIVKKLLKFKADVNIIDNSHLNPLDYAIRLRKFDIISILQKRERKANFNDSNSESDSDDD